jgi:reverse gyrase
MKHYCKNCGSEIITKRMELPICPICLNATILLHQPTLVDIRRLEAEAQHLIEVPTWETPEQYEKYTGCKYPNTGPVWE